MNRFISNDSKWVLGRQEKQERLKKLERARRNAENNILSWTSIMTHAKRSLVWFFVFSYNFCVSKVFLSVVIPSFDEMVNLQKGVLDKVMRFLNAQKYTYEVIVVDDGSTDGSIEFVEHFTKTSSHTRLIKNTHMGKAGAVTTGVLKAGGEYILFTDMDQATPIEELDKLLPFAKKGLDVIIGSRNRIRRGAPFTRKIMANAAILLRSILIGLPDITDTQCGFKLFSKKSAQDIFTRIKTIHHNFHTIRGSSVTAGFDIELLCIAKNRGYMIKEVPVSWLYVETRRVSPIKDSIEGVMDLLRIKFNDLQGRYG